MSEPTSPDAGEVEAASPAPPSAAELGITAGVGPDAEILGVADILCDETGRVGALSYIVPPALRVFPGDAVHVPFGTRELHGMVLGPGDPARATRELIRVYGRRVSQDDLALASELAQRHFSELPVIAARLSPRSGRGAEPLDAGAPTTTSTLALPDAPATLTRRFYLRAPLVDYAQLAAVEAVRMATTSPRGQVLVLCPTVSHLEAVLSHLPKGAARLDTKAPTGAWRGFCEGTLRIALGTRSAALYSATHLSGIIVVEEDHPGHLEATQPHTNARDIAAYRSLRNRIPLTLIGANPTPAGLGTKVKLMPVGTRADWPSIRVIDRTEFNPSDRLVPPPVRAAIERTLRAERQVLVLAEKRRAVRRCTRCATPRPCTSCDDSNCRHPETTPCPKCGGTTVRMTGWDAARLTQVLGPRVRPVTVQQLGEPIDGSPVGLVLLFDLDPALSFAGLAPESVASHIVVSAAAAATRAGMIVVCTSQPDHPLVVDLCARKDQVAVAKRGWEGARAAKLPPFGRLVTVRSGQPKAPKVENWPGRVHGPRKVGSEWEVLVRCSDTELKALGRILERLRRGGKIRITVA